MNKEHILQSKCVIEFSRRFPERRGNLFAMFSETTSAIQGAQMNSLGLVRGVSDLLYVDEGKLIGVEMKCPGTYHNRLHLIEQANWLIKVPYRGYFCDSIDVFFDIIDGKPGILPHLVLDHCNKVKTTSMKWDFNII